MAYQVAKLFRGASRHFLEEFFYKVTPHQPSGRIDLPDVCCLDLIVESFHRRLLVAAAAFRLDQGPNYAP
jgi:hypothetical protein